ncbi:CMD domain protein [Microbacterium sp. cf332]|uniref:CMD domain protein n=1 Tax=Microbacterium sp. cf332 TaxID=1761804 RepID=UPI000886AD7A|nr:CMD domain protein [Microbacterium sp. cf332]SDQ46758.1 CMD domain protein, Avi_7170 family [Microbacterium sp. cf332]
MTTGSADIIDLLAGIRADDVLSRVRDTRAQARENAQRSFEALLEPADAGTVPLAERYAVAAFVAELHGFAQAVDFYRDLLDDEAASLTPAVAAAAESAWAEGPYGRYREPALRSEGRDGPRWSPEPATAAALGERLTAALAHAHLLVFRPREARPEHLSALVAAGWSADGIVTLSQLIAFLAFQLRSAWALRVIAAHPVAATVPASVEGATS